MKNTDRLVAFLDSSISRVTILPTEKCNLRCTYCYETHDKGAMSDSVARSVTKFLQRNIPGKRRFYLSWFGGEPLLEKNRVLTITRSCMEFCEAHGVGMETEITTNAIFLNDAFLSAAAELGRFVFQITLDGPRSHHDRHRIGPHAAPTYDLVIKAIQRTVAHPGNFTIVARIHFDRDSAGETVGFAHEVREILGERGTVFVRPIARLGGAKDAAICVPDQIVSQTIEDTLARDGFKTMADESVCYAALPNSLVIRADGRVSKCTVALNDPRNTVGQIAEDGRLKTNSQLQAWFEGWYEGNAETLRCPYSKIAADKVQLA